MLLRRLCAALVVAVPLVGQSGGTLVERIRRAPLTDGERQAVTTAFSQKDFDRLEGVLAGSSLSSAPKERAAALHALLGAMEFLGGRMRPAVQAFRQADALVSLDDPDRFTLAMALVNLAEVQAAGTELSRLNQRHPGQAIYLYWLARLDYDQRLYEDAVEKFKRVIAMEPASVRGYDNLGLAYDMMGLTEEAQAAFSKAVTFNRKLSTPSAWPPHDLGYLQLRLQQFEQAEQSLREALKYDPNFAEAHYHLGRALENQGRNDAAIEEYKSAAALDVKLATPLYSLGLLYRRSGRDAEAASALAEYQKRKALAGSQ